MKKCGTAWKEEFSKWVRGKHADERAVRREWDK
jgi:hypothetical protein